MASPLAKRLFAVDGVAGVFFGSDFVTVTKTEDAQWPVLKPLVFAAIMDHFGSGEPLFSDAEALAASDTAIHPDDDEVPGGGEEKEEERAPPAAAAFALPSRLPSRLPWPLFEQPAQPSSPL